MYEILIKFKEFKDFRENNCLFKGHKNWFSIVKSFFKIGHFMYINFVDENNARYDR